MLPRSRPATIEDLDKEASGKSSSLQNWRQTSEQANRRKTAWDEAVVGLRATQGGSERKRESAETAPGRGRDIDSTSSWAYGSYRRKYPGGTKSSLKTSIWRQTINLVKSVNNQQSLLEQERKTAEPTFMRVSSTIVDHSFFVCLTTCFTVWALAADDIRLMATAAPADYYFDVLTVICLLVFFVEIVLSCLGKKDYVCGFFFWLDVCSLTTLVFEITSVNEAVLQNETEDVEDMGSSKTARLARAARMVKVLRLVRILKLYKVILDSKRLRFSGGAKDDNELTDDAELELLMASNSAESKIAKRLSDLTLRRCVILVLGMMLFYPLLEPDKELYLGSMPFGAGIVTRTFADMLSNSSRRWLYEEALLRYVHYHNPYARIDESACTESLCPAHYMVQLIWIGVHTSSDEVMQENAGLARLSEASLDSWDEGMGERNMYFYRYGSLPRAARTILTSEWKGNCRSKASGFRRGISLLDVDDPMLVPHRIVCPEDLRVAERIFVSATAFSAAEMNKFHFIFVFDKRTFVRRDALINLMTTFFLGVLLIVASMMFMHDTEVLVLKPLESMMMKIRMIRIDPLIAATFSDHRYQREEETERESMRWKTWQESNGWRAYFRTGLSALCCSIQKGERAKPMETQILETTVVKLGTLLVLGFGRAGVRIISNTMNKEDSANVDVMGVGHTVDCMFVQVGIGEFGHFAEVLQSSVMKFVNQVAEIVHGVADACNAAPNKNRGDTFVAVWRLNQEDTVARFADLAILAASLMLAAVSRSATLAVYRSHPGLQQRLGSHPRVRLSFGINCGWAIEGALGSEFKIDAAYVSPSVSITMNVQRATEIYGTSMLLTEAAQAKCSREIANSLRLVDRVKIKGSVEPMNLYTMDLATNELVVEEPMVIQWSARQLFRARQHLELEKTVTLNTCTWVIFDSHPDLIEMRSKYPVEFLEVFRMGFQNYSEGEWKAAQRFLQRALTVLGFDDGPCNALLRYMSTGYNFEAPAWWKGFHELEDGLHLLEKCRGGSFSLAPQGLTWRATRRSCSSAVSPSTASSVSFEAARATMSVVAHAGQTERPRPDPLLPRMPLPGQLAETVVDPEAGGLGPAGGPWSLERNGALSS